MRTAVLQDMKEVADCRAQLSERKLGWKKNGLRLFLENFHLIPAQPNIGDELKSWDVLRTANFATENLKPTDPVLDIGAFASEILVVLHRLGFSNLAGADLNPSLRSMPYPNKIRYEVTDFLNTPFADNSFAMVTAISVIEHGFQPDRLLSEVGRLLKPNGFFVASFDYWPEKIPTDGIKMFGMDWRIFSEQDVHELIERAGTYGLSVHGEVDLKAKERPISCMDRHYTFAWIALKKSG
jgi:SAM-dependent methyltransferase